MAEQVHDAPLHGAERILVIDDDPGLSEVVQLMLAREGYAVEREGTLKGGLRRVGAADFDLVVTYLKLPDGTGLDAIPAIRSLHEGLPIILMTSYSSVESAIAALRAGAVDYITKPFQHD
jgi:DNA-binding response OmpR family regulator